MTGEGIELVHVTKQYNARPEKKTALKDITLSIRKGEYIGLLGMNGSGKSTLAKLFNGLLKPTAGKVYVNGMDTAITKNLTEIRSPACGHGLSNPGQSINRSCC